MRKYRFIFLSFLVICFLTHSISAYAIQGKRMVWSKTPNKRTGLYTTRNPYTSNGFFITANAMYYFGDVDNEGVAFNGGFNKENLSYGGSLIIGYIMPIGNHTNLRYSFLGGTLSGNNKAKFDLLTPPRKDYRKFQSFILQPSVGVEYYPFSRAGFFLYGGVAFTASIISNFEFWHNKSTPSGKELIPLRGNTFGFLPMLQLAIGYNWQLNRSWSLGIEMMIQEGVVDTHYMNLDAYPLAPSQNSEGISMGGSFGSYIDRYGKEQIRWNDGWYHLGITIIYSWSDCEKCNVIDNYYRTKGRR